MYIMHALCTDVGLEGVLFPKRALGMLLPSTGAPAATLVEPISLHNFDLETYAHLVIYVAQAMLLCVAFATVLAAHCFLVAAYPGPHMDARLYICARRKVVYHRRPGSF